LLCFALLCFALLCFALLCFALLCFALLCFALLCFAFNLMDLLIYEVVLRDVKSILFERQVIVGCVRELIDESFEFGI
jgi:hypothetical protein